MSAVGASVDFIGGTAWSTRFVGACSGCPAGAFIVGVACSIRFVGGCSVLASGLAAGSAAYAAAPEAIPNKVAINTRLMIFLLWGTSPEAYGTCVLRKSCPAECDRAYSLPFHRNGARRPGSGPRHGCHKQSRRGVK